jgi:predicted tellurium resistance membrane protein TerC
MFIDLATVNNTLKTKQIYVNYYALYISIIVILFMFKNLESFYLLHFFLENVVISLVYWE